MANFWCGMFLNRIDAGSQLAGRLREQLGEVEGLVVGLARGGVVVAHALAASLKLPLDVIVVRKIGAPDNPELALGAVAEDGTALFNEKLIEALGVSQAYLRRALELELEKGQARAKLYRGKVSPHPLVGQRVIVVDDGIATGASMKVAVHSLYAQGVKEVILAVPVAASEALAALTPEVDQVICLSAPRSFEAVGAFYRDFAQTSDEEVIALLYSPHKFLS